MPVRRAKQVNPLVVCLFIFALPAAAQISPGALSRSHQSLEGVLKCSSCHDFGAGARRFRCLECHTEIQHRVASGSGFHSRAYKPSTEQIDCVRCHMEHNGVKFALTRFDTANFDHRASTGFELEGRHKEQKCESCHNGKHIDAKSRPEIKITDVNHSYLGLRRECSSCHEDAHAGQLGAKCVTCHNQQAWKPAPGFSHAKAAFPLTGQHQTVTCAKCHTPSSSSPARPAAVTAKASFKGIPFSGCQSCHTDPHKGGFQETKFRGGCDTCHTTAGWKGNRPGATFNHSLTRFPLTGKHAEKSCAQCHRDSDFHRPLKSALCADCHEDAHSGQFAGRASGSDCGSCHNESGYKPTLFSRDTHLSAAFPLRDKHATVECASCHKPEGKQTVWKTGKVLCAGCHQDPHATQFAAAPWTNQCSLCHQQSGFDKTTFTVARHSATRFPLEGRHSAVACEACHKVLPDSGPPAGLLARLPRSSPARQFQFADRSCASCHADPHRPAGPQVAANSATNTNARCEDCHTPAAWNQTKPFDHSRTRFPLEGSHQRAVCAQCHTAPATPSGSPRTILSRAVPALSQTPALCSDCHSGRDPHGGQFQARRTPESDDAEQCSACHTTSRWSGADFNHDKTRYPLDHRHNTAECARCHKTVSNIGGRAVRIYRATPTDCVACH